MEKKQSILVIQTAFLGDVILSTPLIRGIHETFPQADIDVVTTPQASGLFKYNPFVRRTYCFDKKHPLGKWWHFYRLTSTLRRQKYNLAFSAQLSFTSALMMKLSAIPRRVGFPRQKLLTDPVAPPEKGLHMTLRYISLLRPFNPSYNRRETELYWGPAEEAKVRPILKTLSGPARRRIGVAPGSVWETKRWPEDHFSELSALLDKNGADLFFIGGPEDRNLCDSIIRQSGAAAVNTAGQLSLLESAALISQLDLMITNDSAPLHMADAVNTPVFAFFGPTVKQFGCYPYRSHDQIFEIDLYCRPCSRHGTHKCPEGHFRCMLEINPQNVANKVEEYFNQG